MWSHIIPSLALWKVWEWSWQFCGILSKRKQRACSFLFVCLFLHKSGKHAHVWLEHKLYKTEDSFCFFLLHGCLWVIRSGADSWVFSTVSQSFLLCVKYSISLPKGRRLVLGRHEPHFGDQKKVNLGGKWSRKELHPLSNYHNLHGKKDCVKRKTSVTCGVPSCDCRA